MRIKTSNQSHTMYRYGGMAAGKPLGIKIGAVPTGTAPDAIPADLLDDLTPKERRQLHETLAQEQMELWGARLQALVSEIASAAKLLSVESLDAAAAENMLSALSSLQSSIRRVQRDRSAAEAAKNASQERNSAVPAIQESTGGPVDAHTAQDGSPSAAISKRADDLAPRESLDIDIEIDLGSAAAA